MTVAGRISAYMPSGSGRGLLLALQSGVLFQLMNAVVKHLATQLPPLFVAWGRWTFGFLCIAPFLLRGGLGAVRTRLLHLHVMRGLLHASGYALWYSAVASLPLAKTAALGFTGPIFVSLGAALFLGERLQLHRVLAIVAGFVGVLIILRPGLIELSTGALMMLASVPLIAGSNLMAKVVAGRDRPEVVVFWQSLLASLIFLPAGLWVWETPDAMQLAWMVAAAMLGTSAYMLLTWAMRLVEITALQPMTFLNIVWAGLLDWAVVGRTTDIWTFIGGAVVIGSTSFIAHREAKQIAR